LVLRLVLEELVDVLDGRDAVLLLRDDGEVEVRQLVGTQGAVEGPLGQGDVEEGLLLRLVGDGETGEGQASGGGQEAATVEGVHGVFLLLERGWNVRDGDYGASPSGVGPPGPPRGLPGPRPASPCSRPPGSCSRRSARRGRAALRRCTGP